jgi:hypothetical protein
VKSSLLGASISPAVATMGYLHIVIHSRQRELAAIAQSCVIAIDNFGAWIGLAIARKDIPGLNSFNCG